MEICEVCKKPVDKCTCCPECGHICDLDQGEYYCPVCFPRIRTGSDDESGKSRQD